MNGQERVARAQQYLQQALERLAAAEAAGLVTERALGEWVSLRRNLESALQELERLTKEA
jgi:hypothetical protein